MVTAARFPTRSAGTAMCTPFVPSTEGRDDGLSMRLIASVHGPVAFTTDRPRTSITSFVKRSRTDAPLTRPRSNVSDVTSA